MNKIDFQKLEKREDMIIAFNDLKNDYRQLFAINDDLEQELQRKDNIINELKEYLKLEIAEWQDVDNIPTRARVEEDKDILDKIKELESK